MKGKPREILPYIKRLMEEIHIATAKNEKINQIMEEIAKEGFDVMYFLQPTLRLTKRDSDADDQTNLELNDKTPFSKSDDYFLKKMKISLGHIEDKPSE